MKITDIFDIRLKYLVEALPSHGKLKLALFGNLKLACVNGTQKAAKHVGKPLATKKKLPLFSPTSSTTCTCGSNRI